MKPAATNSGSKALGKTRVLVALFFGLATLLTIAPKSAEAGSSSSLVTVSVRVVESCRVEVAGSAQSDASDLRMRCSSTARPSLGLVGNSQSLAPVASMTLSHTQIAATENGKTLSIQF